LTLRTTPCINRHVPHMDGMDIDYLDCPYRWKIQVRSRLGSPGVVRAFAYLIGNEFNQPKCPHFHCSSDKVYVVRVIFETFNTSNVRQSRPTRQGLSLLVDEASKPSRLSIWVIIRLQDDTDLTIIWNRQIQSLFVAGPAAWDSCSQRQVAISLRIRLVRDKKQKSREIQGEAYYSFLVSTRNKVSSKDG